MNFMGKGSCQWKQRIRYMMEDGSKAYFMVKEHINGIITINFKGNIEMDWNKDKVNFISMIEVNAWKVVG